jgi:hypothetical protein
MTIHPIKRSPTAGGSASSAGFAGATREASEGGIAPLRWKDMLLDKPNREQKAKAAKSQTGF